VASETSGAADYDRQLDAKHEALKALFAGLDIPIIEVFASAPRHYRMRAEFRIWHEGGEMFYAMFERGQKASGASLIRCDQFPAASESINALMPKLIEAASNHPELKNRWYAVEFLSTLSGEMLVTMIYHKKLNEAWQQAAQELAHNLGIHIIGRSRGQKIILSQDFVTEALTVNGKTFRYRQVEGSFTQPNARVCEKMLGWACDVAQNLSGDLLELYCGNGNFTLPLSQHFRQVLATEVSKTSVYAAQWNIEVNQRDNIKIARLSAEEFTEAYTQSREFRRLQEQGISLKDYDFSTIFVDPPRAGVDDETLKLVSQFDNIIYISCNPATFARDVKILAENGYVLKKITPVDMFPQTAHIEVVGLLEKL